MHRFPTPIVLAIALLACAPPAHAMPSLVSVGPPFKVFSDPDVSSEPQSVAFSPRGGLLAAADAAADAVAMFSVSPTGALTRLTPAGTGDKPMSVAFNHDGSLLATANAAEGSVSVFRVSAAGDLTSAGPDTKTGSGSQAVAFSPRDPLLVTANADGDSLSVFGVSEHGALTDKPEQLIDIDGPVALAFSPDGSLLAVVGKSSELLLLSVSPDGTLTPVGDPQPTSDSRSVAFSRDGKWLAVPTYFEGSVSIFSVTSSGLVATGGTPVRTFAAAVAFSPTTDVVAVGLDEWVATVSVSASGQATEVDRLTNEWESAVAFSPDGRMFASADYINRSISVFLVSPSGRLTAAGSPVPLEGPPNTIAFYPQHPERFLVSTSAGLTGWILGDREFVEPFTGYPIDGEQVSAAFSDDGLWLASVDADGALWVDELVPFGGVFGPLEVDDRLSTIAMGQGGRVVAASAKADRLHVFSVTPEDGVVETSAPQPTGHVPSAVALSRDDQLAATANRDDDTVSVFGVAPDGSAVSKSSAKTGRFPSSLAFSPTEDLVAVANEGSDTVSVYAVVGDGQLQPVGTPVATGHFPHAVAFSRDGRLLATANRSADSVSVFVVAPGGALTAVGPQSPTGRGPVSISFSADGKLLATANADDQSFSLLSVAAPGLETSIVSGPPATTASTSATFGLDATYPATFECRLGNDPFEPCSSPVSYSGLGEGDHTVRVRARDLLGTPADTIASRTWTVDLTAPVKPALGSPGDGAANLRSTTTFSWAPTTDELTSVDRYELWVDGAVRATVPSAACAATCSATPDGLSHGAHAWRVRAIDAVGNGADSASRALTVDAAPPSQVELAGPADDVATTDRRPLLSWQPTSDAGAGLSGYDVVLDDQVAASLDSFATSFTPSAELSEGVHRWHVVARDANGNEGASATRRFAVDATPPTAVLAAAPNPALAGRTVTLDASGSSDGSSGIARYEWDLDGDGAFERDTGAAATTAQTFREPGTFGIQLRVTDRAGWTATTRLDQRVTADNRGRRQLGVSINDGAGYTNDPNVTISAAWPSFAGEMLVSNDGGFKAAHTLALRPSTPWTLDSSGAERLPKIVYVRFVRGLAVSETYTDDIILDQRAPMVLSADVSSRRRGALLRLRADDRGPAGLKAVQVANDRRHPRARFHAYRKRVTLVPRKGERRLSLARHVYVRVRDRAGNLSSWRAAKRGGQG
jgi:6-phosphogluconolactonase (cycloisomerase 2 family)